MYRVPEGHSGLEVFRNYQHAVAEAGFALTYEFTQPDNYWVQGFVGYSTISWASPWRPLLARSPGRPPFHRDCHQGRTEPDGRSAGWRKQRRQMEHQSRGTQCSKPGEVLAVLTWSWPRRSRSRWSRSRPPTSPTCSREQRGDQPLRHLFRRRQDRHQAGKPQDAGRAGATLAPRLIAQAEIVGLHPQYRGQGSQCGAVARPRCRRGRCIGQADGVDAALLRAKGYGDSKPVAANDTEGTDGQKIVASSCARHEYDAAGIASRDRLRPRAGHEHERYNQELSLDRGGDPAVVGRSRWSAAKPDAAAGRKEARVLRMQRNCAPSPIRPRAWAATYLGMLWPRQCAKPPRKPPIR